MWQFKIQHKPEKLHLAPGAMSRHPMKTLFETEDKVEMSSSKILAWIRLSDDECIVASLQVGNNRRAVTFQGVREKTLKAEKIMTLT